MSLSKADFWSGPFGDEYTDRNSGEILQSIAFTLRTIETLKIERDLKSILELGPNRGMNTRAFRTLFPFAKIECVEINEKAANLLKHSEIANVYNVDFLKYETNDVFDLVVSSYFLIHMEQHELENIYRKIAKSINRIKN